MLRPAMISNANSNHSHRPHFTVRLAQIHRLGWGGGGVRVHRKGLSAVSDARSLPERKQGHERHKRRNQTRNRIPFLPVKQKEKRIESPRVW